MITIIGAVIGFLGSLMPECLKYLSDQRDKQHEIAMLQLQLQHANQRDMHRADAIGESDDAALLATLYRHTWHTDISWVNALNGTVRPVIAYGFFLLYAAIKIMQFQHMPAPEFVLPWHIARLWDANDQAIFAGIISFYFGQRSLSKYRTLPRRT